MRWRIVAKKETKTIKISIEAYTKLKHWKNIDESNPQAMHRLLEEYKSYVHIESQEYVVDYKDTSLHFKVVGDELKYYHVSEDNWWSSIDAWVDVANGFHYVEIIDFFKNFLLKESAMILLKDMGDELVYGDYIIRKL